MGYASRYPPAVKEAERQAQFRRAARSVTTRRGLRDLQQQYPEAQITHRPLPPEFVALMGCQTPPHGVRLRDA